MPDLPPDLIETRTTMADLLTSIHAEIVARLRELEPAIAEFERLNTAAEALAKEDPSTTAPAKHAASPRPARASAGPRVSAGPRAPAKRATPKKATPAPKKTSLAKPTARAGKRAQPTQTPTGQAILAALEHGSHTLAELVVVTALRAPDIRQALRHLLTRKAIVKTDRDGKAAYALPS